VIEQRILVLSDIHEDLEGIAAMAAPLQQADTVILAGDLTRNGDATAIARVVDAVRQHAPNVIAVHGNCDQASAARWLDDAGISVHRRCKTVGGISYFGVGGSNPTPMHTASEYSEAQLATYLEDARTALESDPAGATVRLAVVHPPPHDTKLDRMFLGLHVGSASVRGFIDRVQPDVLVCGHIHESRGVTRVGRTLCVNPGGFVGHRRYAEITVTGQDAQARLRQLADRPGRLSRAWLLARKVAS
jgi:uncharacterized protein